MPNSVIARIKWAPKLIAVGAVCVAVLLLGAVLLFTRQPTATTLRAGGQTFTLQIARTMAAQTKGLGGRLSMPQRSGMLFVFDSEAPRCFWMKDMRFPLDIVWLNEHKQVVSMETNVSPNTYPQNFCPEDAAQYVIELNAAQAAAVHIREGQQLTF